MKIIYLLLLCLFFIASTARKTKKRKPVVNIKKIKEHSVKLAWKIVPGAAKYYVYWTPALYADVAAETGGVFTPTSKEIKKMKRKLLDLPSGMLLKVYIVAKDEEDKYVDIIWGKTNFKMQGENDGTYSPKGTIWFEPDLPQIPLLASLKPKLTNIEE